MKPVHRTIAPLCMIIGICASAGSALAAPGDVVAFAYQPDASWGTKDCAAMEALPGVSFDNDVADGVVNWVACSSEALGTSSSVDGKGGVHLVPKRELDDFVGYDFGVGKEMHHDGWMASALCPIQRPDGSVGMQNRPVDRFGASITFVGDIGGPADTIEIVVGVEQEACAECDAPVSAGLGHYCVLSVGSDGWPVSSTPFAFTSPGLDPGFHRELARIGDHYCTGNAAGQVVCFKFDGLGIEAGSEVVIDSSSHAGLAGVASDFGRVVASANGRLMVGDDTKLYALALDSSASVTAVAESEIQWECAGLSAIEVIPDLDFDGVDEIFVGNPAFDQGYGSLCQLFMNGDGSIRSGRLLSDNGDYGIPSNAVNGLGAIVRYGASIAYVGDNGDGTRNVLVGVPYADFTFPYDPPLFAPDNGSFFEFVMADATYGLPADCPPQPAPGCLEGLQGSLKVARSDFVGKHSMKWQWKKGAPFSQATLGNPVSSTTYAVCVYDRNNGATRIAGAYAIAPGTSWASKDPQGFQYKDKEGSSDGVTQAKIKTGTAGKTQFQVAWKGANFLVPTPVFFGKFFSADPAVTLQLHNSEGACWTSAFSEPFKSNVPKKFQAAYKP